MPELPDLILHPTRAYGRPPYIGSQALLQAGWITGRRTAVQSLLDNSLNLVAPGKVRVTALLDQILITSLHVAEMRSGHPFDRSWGFVPESDIALWALVYAEAPGLTGTKTLYWTPIYMFVDDAAATAGGREIFGFPKIHAEIIRPGTGESDFGLTVAIKAFSVPGPDRPVENIEVLRISQGGLRFERTDPDGLLDVPWLAPHRLADRIAGAVLPKITLPSVEFPVLQLKQVPSIANPAKADYQALVALRMKSLKLHGAGRAKGNPMVRIGSPLSLPVAASLGAAPAQKLEFPAWLIQDFETATGEVLAEARGA